jgi:uncharacterized membrane protein
MMAVAVPDAAELPLTTAIARPARTCYELFCDAERVPEWLSVVRSARVRQRNRAGRPSVVTFLAELERATVGYTLDYDYRERDLGVSWSTALAGNLLVAGWAQFTPLGPAAALMTYQLVLDVECAAATWRDPFFDGHPASSVMSDFRDFAVRAADLREMR